MTAGPEAHLQFTLDDIEVGAQLVEVLVQHAKASQGAPISYADLLSLARQLYPKDAAIDRAVPVGVGMKLRFIEQFCTSHAYPNLACLAVNDTSMRPGAEAERRAVAAFDWAAVQPQFVAYADKVRKAVPPWIKRRKERPADVAWYAYFCSHRDACKAVTAEDKQEIINLLMAGLAPEAALKRVLDARALPGDQ